MIPSFNSAGVIPPYLTNPGSGDRSPYATNIIEFVQTFGFSPERRAILRGLISYRRLLYEGGFTEGYQLLNGSFVEDCEGLRKRPPSDIDIFSCLLLPQKYMEDPALFQDEGMPFLTREAMTTANKQRFKVDAYLVVTPPGMAISDFFHAFAHFTLLFSHQKGTDLWKGAVSVPLDPGTDGAAEKALTDLENQ